MGRLISEETWESLLDGSAVNGLIRLRVAPEAPVDVFVAVEQPGETRLLLFALQDGDQASSFDIPEATGVLSRAVATGSGNAWGFAEVRLVDRRFGEVFTSLANDLVEHVCQLLPGERAIDRLADRLRRWEAFLKVVGPDGLSHERRAGLYGELHILRTYLLPLDTGLTTSWVGPMGAQQDFQGNGWALEVKTTRTKEPVSVRISGERQLADIGLDYLGLAHIGLEERQNSGETLPEIVASVRALLANTSEAETFEAGLLAAGYSAIHEHRYLDRGYVIRFAELFRVGQGFPRITEADLMKGVGDVSYSVSVAALSEFRADWDDLPSVAAGLSDR